MKRVWKAKEVINGWEGKPIKIQKPDDPFDEEEAANVEVGDMTIFDAMLFISNINQIGSKQLVETLDDASKKKSLKQSLKASVKTGRIELEGEVFKWLKTVSEIVCPIAWQDNANEVYDIITEGFKKENEDEPSKSKGTKAGKKAKDDKATKEGGAEETEER